MQRRKIKWERAAGRVGFNFKWGSRGSCIEEDIVVLEEMKDGY